MEQDDKYHEYANLPIPSYEEATSSRPTSSQNYRGPEEVSDDAERQGLLEQQGGYRQATVESARSSVDSDLRLPEVTGDDDRRQIEELDYLDPDSSETSGGRRGLYHRARLRSQFSKHLANISATFSSIRLPSFRSLYTPVPLDDARNPTATEAPPTRRTWLPQISSALAIPEQYRISAPTFARLCGLFTIAGVIYILFAMDMFPNPSRQGGVHADPEAVRQFVQETAGADSIAQYLHHITSYDHVAGTEGDLFLAKWMQERWVEGEWFDEVALLDYYVYMNYPTKNGRSVKIVEPEAKKWKAQLEERQGDNAKTQTWAWHGHSKSGEAKGHLIYANGGSREDFRWLKDHGVETKGAVALVREYGAQSDIALKIQNAEKNGCVGVLIYSDPSDDGEGKGDVWPDGPWRREDSLQRGDVSLTNRVVGDPLTPGWASTLNADREKPADNPGLPSLPSLPLAWRDAEVLIEALKSQGVEVPQNWIGGTSGKKNAWFSGTKDGKDTPIVELRNHNDENSAQQIWNLHGLIEGLEAAEKKVIVGNHRDSWCFGAADPGSGSAVMMEVVNIFQNLRALHWRPLRTIEFVSWDAGKFNFMGSTEYIEDNLESVRENGVAYLNVDAGVFGPDFHASASPLWQKALMHVLGRVADPVSNKTIKRHWQQSNSKLQPLDSYGDYLPFQALAGISSLDFGFRNADSPHANPSGSCYDTFHWMTKFGDPGDFQYHRILAQIWALLILEIADRPLIPFDLRAYADAIQLHIKQLQQFAEERYALLNDENKKALTPELLKEKTNGVFDLVPLKDAADKLNAAVKTFHRFEDVWSTNVMGAGGLESSHFAFRRLEYNDKIARFESDLLDLPYEHGDKENHGIPGREQFKHILYGPTASSENDERAYFPAIRDAVYTGAWEDGQKMVERAAKVLERAGRRLVENE